MSTIEAHISIQDIQSKSMSKPAANSPAKDNVIYTVDDFIRQLGAEKDQVPLLAYPKVEHGLSLCERYTGQDLDRFTDAAAKRFMNLGLPPVHEHMVVAIFALSNLDYLVSLLGLGRLGYATLLISSRLSAEACTALLEEIDSEILIYAPILQSACDQIQQRRQLKLIPLLSRQNYDVPIIEPRFTRHVDGKIEKSREIFILHSSGSTGLPKPLRSTHCTFLLALAHPLGGMTAFSSLPCYHMHGLAAPFMNWNKRKIIYLWDNTIPQTHESLTTALQFSQPEVVYTVPYILKLLAEKQRGIDLLKACKMVSFSGSVCPDELGDTLVGQGIHLGSLFGSTECGMLFSSVNRPRKDTAWNYLRVSPHVAPYLYMKPVEANVFECVVLDGFPNKAVSNSNDPPNSFHSKDLFTPHSTIPDAWKFIGRSDDRITLINGEKVLPLPIEGRIRQNPLVKEAVVFGIGKSIPGLLLFRADSAADLSDEKFTEQVWPAVQNANSRAEGFSQISKEMIIPLSTTIEFSSTDKGSIKRVQVYNEFAAIIELAYENFDNCDDGDLELDLCGLEKFIMTTFEERLNITLATVETDFYGAGVDSLKAIQMRGLIRKTLKLGAKMDSMVVFSCGNAARLARYLHAIQTGEEVNAEDEIEAMSKLVEKYSLFDKHVPGKAVAPETRTVVLTGATGGLGSHVLAQLIDTQNVSKIYCLVRAKASEGPLDRLLNVLHEQGHKVSNELKSKVVALTCDFRQPDLGLKAEMLEIMRQEVSLIIHSAWAVNFAVGVKSFEEYHIKGLHHLLQFSLSVKAPQPAQFFFCSSISAAMGSPAPATIPEEIIENLAHSANLGYARSKLVGEQIVRNAAVNAGASTRVLRIGQIVGNRTLGLWNASEAIPLMIRSALELKALPALDESCSWLPVDTVAASILNLCGISNTSLHPARQRAPILVYNLVHPAPFPWTETLLPALRAAGLRFETVPFAAWLQRLKSSPYQDAQRYPYVKLVQFWERQLANGEKRGGGRLGFDTSVAKKDSMALRNAPDIVEEGYVDRFVRTWFGDEVLGV